jgi:leucyl aminopeptidase
MKFTLKKIDPVTTRCDCLVLGIAGEKHLGEAARAVDEATGGLLRRLLKADIAGKVRQSLLVPAPAGIAAERLLLVGLGENGKPLSVTDANRVIATLAGAVKGVPGRQVAVLLDGLVVDGVDARWPLRETVKALAAATYRFEAYKGEASRGKAARAPRPEDILLGHSASAPTAADKAALRLAEATWTGMALARDLGNTPPNVCNPVWLEGQAKDMARGDKRLKVTVLGPEQMKKLGMGAFLAVAQGSSNPGRLIAMEYQGGKAGAKPVVLVGKGITFDTGGISLKPGAGMDEMKYDMCGAASVFGVMRAALELDLKINLVGVVAAAENMPGGKASRPGDIVTTMAGKTVEILNTDAEGRLVLCDAITWARRYKPRVMIDIATLTGACVVALGSHPHGLFSNHQPLADELLACGVAGNDRGWQMPLWDEYQEMLDSPFADMANIGNAPRAGSITAACFLARYAEDLHWAHLDIAGTAWHGGGPAKGATGRPVALLMQYLDKLASH